MKKKKSTLLKVAFSLLYVTSISGNSTAVKLAPIGTTGGTIDTAGNYYLGYDITGDIMIAADRVILNLNEHTVSGAIRINGNSDIAIMNGTILPESSNGIEILNNSNNICIKYITVSGSTSDTGAVYIVSSNNIFISHVLAEDFTSNGINTFSVDGAVIEDCMVIGREQTGTGLTADGSNIIVRRCVENNCQDGYQIVGERIYCFDCIARNNSRHGFTTPQSDSPIRAALFNCIAENNSNRGFDVSNVDDAAFILQGCIARNNTDAGFSVLAPTGGLVQECTAISNSECGFNTTASDTLVTYVANYAAFNSTSNYCISGADAGGSLPYRRLNFDDGDAQFWRNTQPS